MKRMVIIDADAALRPLLQEVLGSEGYETVFCQDSAAAHRCARDADPDAVMIDVNLEAPGAGWSVLEALKTDDMLRDRPIIVCSADRMAIDQHADYLESRNCMVLLKPLTLDALLTVTEQMIAYPERQHRRLQKAPLPARRTAQLRWSGAA
jgi:CheY-like chemotaxis protein